ncbi:pyruvate kinase [Halorhodospira abdelmalekii]|uniref:pyruvate kinase n=1 Tax=Halorhodospira abdelmalekii TaxID=421629 RepID=UPI0019060321|nr:pyruvate kinase [Halorhodospira abdelmalekii]MBK1733994.1 pyruvate kinase [Halorhodospira abdelmalekii]
MVKPRRTKILATLGPATDRPGALASLLSAGVDVVRINLSHGVIDDHRRRVEAVREWSAAHRRRVGVLVDLQGPKIRIECFRHSPVELREGDSFVLDAALAADAGTREAVGIAYTGLPDDVVPGDELLLDDGRLVLSVDRVVGSAVHTTVVTGGELSDRKGINRRGGGLSAPALTAKDRRDIVAAVDLEADYLAVSFPRAADDIHEARELLRGAGGDGIGVVAKIERAEAVAAADEIIEAADAIMVARGDLGVEIGDAALPEVQKRLIHQARRGNRAVITATQMMESMIENPIPTRAEVFDVANAVLDGTDAVMLSAETAAGRYPERAVAAMDRVCREAEKNRTVTVSHHRLDECFGRVDETIAMAAMYAANHFAIKALIVMTESGSTAAWMSRISSGLPIYVLTSHPRTRGRVTLYRGVYPLELDPEQEDLGALKGRLLERLARQGLVTRGDYVVVTHGDQLGASGGTNALRIICVDDYLNHGE